MFDRKEYRRKYYREYWHRNPEQYEKHKERMRISGKKYKKKHNENNKSWRLKMKIRVLSRYSSGGVPECANPFGEHQQPYTTIEALSIDHINGGGCKHRKELKIVGCEIYRWLEKNNYPDGYQVLCMNCQFIKSKRSSEHRT